MNEILDFLAAAKVFFLATADSGQPHVRPMGFVMVFEGKLSFCTSNRKAMYRQLKANPKMEIAATLPDGKTLRMSGPVSFNPSRAAKEKALEIMPHLKTMYHPDDGVFEVFQFDNAVAVFSGMDGAGKEIKI
jgi:uncharacterized pyridoxamine 5'-phosphate oxidase family protein